jgi:hypothetical protein
MTKDTLISIDLLLGLFSTFVTYVCKCDLESQFRKLRYDVDLLLGRNDGRL